MSATVPIYVSVQQSTSEFNPGSGLPIIIPTGTFFTDQTALDNVQAAAIESDVQLYFSDTGGTPPPPINTEDSFISFLPQSLSSDQQAQARTNIGAGTGSGGGGGGSGTVTSVNGQAPDGTGNVAVNAGEITGFATVAVSGAYNDLSGKPTLGTAAAHAATDFDSSGAAAAAQSAAIAASVPTSRTVAGHALTGNVVVSASDITTGALGLAQILAALESVGIPMVVTEVSGSYPNRPATTGKVFWFGADQPAAGGTTAGGTAAAVDGLDVYFRTP